MNDAEFKHVAVRLLTSLNGEILSRTAAEQQREVHSG
jgi:hypothetical protein